eukprot:TRINITY_DN50975_c0_g1_i1.p1 TRINITY_DN50975_c0_g1~~TRINITY_DN50975_c0_g1_i1.p1  ORF type:complete len:297 (+),score=61.67 TRINITY_DN50975_c0_g1_i1:89-979(+)
MIFPQATRRAILESGAVAAESGPPLGERQVFENEVSLEFQDGVALITFWSTEKAGKFPWGTRREEHRWNPTMVRAFNLALDEVEANSEIRVVIVTASGKFWSNGMDLGFMDAHATDEIALRELGSNVNDLMARVLCFPLPTIAAFNGHWCAAGGMMGLAFDYRVMANDRGFFFVPGVDLGLVYSPTQIELMKAKLPPTMHRDVIVFNAKRWTGDELAERGVVDATVPAGDVLSKALEIAAKLRPKGEGAARKAMGGIKRGVYKVVLDAVAGGGDMSLVGRTAGVNKAAPPFVRAKL